MGKRVVDYASKNKDEYPDFNEFVSFIEKQALLKNHANVIDRRKGRDQEDHVKSYKGNTITEKENEKTMKHSPFHDANGHELSECKAFSHKTLQERIDWMKLAGLCFLCSVKGHLSKECKKEVKCQKCDSTRHQTILHRERTSVDGEEITSKRTEINGKVFVQ
jgi:hypothetical protein